jgi:hypothetical protein
MGLRNVIIGLGLSAALNTSAVGAETPSDIAAVLQDNVDRIAFRQYY